MWRNKGVHAARVLTAGGEIALRRRYFWGAGQGGIYPVDRQLGLEESRVSSGAREILCRLGIVEDFAGAAEDAKRIGNVPVGKERLRQIVEAEGAKVTQVRSDGTLKAAWTQADETLRTETAAWHRHSNAKQRGVDWQFKVDDARIKLKSVYPKIIV